MHVFQALQLESVPKHKHAFSAEFEEKMVGFFFEKNDCFYSKAFPKYSITSYKRKILQEFARELGTECEFIKIYNELLYKYTTFLN